MLLAQYCNKDETLYAFSTNSELTELVPVFTTRPAFPTSVKKVNTSFKNVWQTWGPALTTLFADLMIFCPQGPIRRRNETKRKEVGRHIIDHLQEELYLCKLLSHRGL
jgi:hypothetical protein